MGKKIIYSNPDGSVDVITPEPQEKVARFVPGVRSMTADQFLNWVSTKDAPGSATNVTVIDESALPSRTNRNLWRWNGVSITVSGVPVSTPSGVKIR